jgi:hypothetical protein
MDTNIRVKLIAVRANSTRETKIICTLMEASLILPEMREEAEKDLSILAIKVELLARPVEVFEAHINELIEKKAKDQKDANKRTG